MNPILASYATLPSFNITLCTKRVVNKLRDSTDNGTQNSYNSEETPHDPQSNTRPQNKLKLRDLVYAETKSEISRNFMSALMLCNKGDVGIRGRDETAECVSILRPHQTFQWTQRWFLCVPQVP